MTTGESLSLEDRISINLLWECRVVVGMIGNRARMGCATNVLAGGGVPKMCFLLTYSIFNEHTCILPIPCLVNVNEAGAGVIILVTG